MANKRIKDLETLAPSSLDGVSDYLVVDDVDGNTSKMSVDALIQNSGPFTDIASLGPPSVYSGTRKGAQAANYLASNIFAYENACWGTITGSHTKAGFSCTFSKSANSSIMNVVTTGGSLTSKTVNSVGTNFDFVKNLGTSTNGVANNTGGGYWYATDASNKGHTISKYFTIQFGTGGFSVWGNYSGRGSSGHNAHPHGPFAGSFSFMFMAWEGV